MKYIIGLLMWPFAIIGYLYTVARAGFVVGTFIANEHLKNN